MVKQYTGYDKDGNPQSPEDYLGTTTSCLPIIIGILFSLYVIMFFI